MGAGPCEHRGDRPTTMLGEDPRVGWRTCSRRVSAATGYRNERRVRENAVSCYRRTQCYVDQALAWLQTLETHYGDAQDGGYHFAADDTTGLITRLKTASDSAVPAGNGTLVEVFTRLFALTGDARFRDAADRQIATFSGEIARNFFPLSTLLNGADLLLRPVQVVLVGPHDSPDMASLTRAAAGPGLPNRILTRLAPDRELPDGHPAAGKTMVDGRATAYICTGPVCSAPITDPEQVREKLAESGFGRS